MDYYREICDIPIYKVYLSNIEEYEKGRMFCHHDMKHFMEVARIGCLWNERQNSLFNESAIIGFALLHDIGRWCEYQTGESHKQASARLAKELLKMTRYSEENQRMILSAIKQHGQENKDEFSRFIDKADKASRECYNCKVQAECYWPNSKKNLDSEAWNHENR